MTIEDQIRDQKLQYDSYREVLPSNQQQIIEQAKFTYSPLGKAIEKQTKTNENQGKKQVDALADSRSKTKKKKKSNRSKPK